MKVNTKSELKEPFVLLHHVFVEVLISPPEIWPQELYPSYPSENLIICKITIGQNNLRLTKLPLT